MEKDDRRARLAEELRENLRRRKAQARLRRQATSKRQDGTAEDGGRQPHEAPAGEAED